MQAGDRLNFVQPFSPFEGGGSSVEKNEKERSEVVFAEIMRHLVFSKPELVQSFDVLEESGFVTVFEASHRLDMPDGSHLHIVAFGHQDEKGLLDAGLSINEHLADGKYNGGYLYTYDADGLRRSTSHPDVEASEDLEDDGDEINDYFSIADLYQGRDQLEELVHSEDTEEMLSAIAHKAMLEEAVALDQLEVSAGFDGLMPYPGELEQVYELLEEAYYFPIHEMSGE